MNVCIFSGRLARDPEVRRSERSGAVVARFSLAIDRGKDKEGKDRGADFPIVVCFGKTAELAEKYCRKGQLIGVEARVVTGKYEKDGIKVFTTEFNADRIEFLQKKSDDAEGSSRASESPAGFQPMTDEDIPF